MHTSSKNPYNTISKNAQYTLLPQWKLHIAHNLRDDTTQNTSSGWKNNVTMDKEEIRCHTQWIRLAEDTVPRWILVNVAVNLWAAQKATHFLPNSKLLAVK